MKLKKIKNGFLSVGNVNKMGYTTEFKGQFDLDKKLDKKTYDLLMGLSKTRRMGRNVDKKFGVEGEFYFKDDGDYGQTREDNIIDYNTPPITQPSLWLQWRPTKDKLHIEWDEGEKFYDYVEWIVYIIENILKPKGYILNGSVKWRGEEFGDLGTIKIKNNVVTTTK